MKKYIAEGFGTFVLALVVITFAAGKQAGLTPVFAAITLALFVNTIGGISGAHLNPAVTIGVWSLKKISRDDALGYIAAQLVGGMLAIAAASLLISDLASKLAGMQVRVTDNPMIAAAEAIGALVFAFGVSAVIHGAVEKPVQGMVVGGSLLVGLFLAGTVSNGVLNPAVAMALGSFNLMYLIGPIVGAVVGMKMYTYLSGVSSGRLRKNPR